MALTERIESDLRAAMLGRRELEVSTLRMLMTAIRNEEVSGSAARTLDDTEVVTVVAREAKKRAESAAIYRDAGREELATKEESEQAVLETYLPAALSDDELDSLVAEAVAESGATDARSMGTVMKILVPKVAGRADNKAVSEKVRKALSG